MAARRTGLPDAVERITDAALTADAAGRPEAIASPRDGMVQAVVSGLAHHSVALIAGYALCLITLLARQRLATPLRQP